MARELTDQQQRFVDAYLSDENLSVAEAARKAGYSENYADSAVYQLLRNPKIHRALDKAMAARARRTRITQDRVLREIASVAFSNIDDYEVDDLGNIHLREGADIRAMKAISSVKRKSFTDKDGNFTVTTEIKLWDKVKASEMLSRHMNLFKEDQEAGAVKIPDRSDNRDKALLEYFGGKDDETDP